MKIPSFLLIILTVSILQADPLVIKGVDGTWLPVLASSWSEKNNGVLVIMQEKTDIAKLREKLSEMFPNLRIDISEKALFFNSTNIDSLFSLLNGAETDIKKPAIVIKGETMLVTDNSTTEPNPGEMEGVVESVSFDAPSGNMFINISVPSGKMTLQVSYKMKDGIADPDDEKNKFFGKLLLIRKGNHLIFTAVKTKGYKHQSIVNYSIKK
ncbi:MAG TPA: hypothetical protein PKG52_06710 [bacterium]|nr:hypothetical protein [bacterium]HPS30756.1 hypothetical protein [bacterium]